MPEPFEPGEEGFDLRIEFSGLCLFVVQSREEVGEQSIAQQVGVAMPDARKHRAMENMKHSDGHPAEPHAGYLRFDLGNLLPGVVKPAFTNSESPHNEVVHRFDRESLDLGLGGVLSPVDVTKLEFPDFGLIDHLKTANGLFSSAPPPDVLTWTKLTGGIFTAHSAGSNWKINGARGLYQGQFANYVVWTRRITGTNSLTLTITSFEKPAKPEPIQVKLTQRDRLIRLKISNLCAENPLEWPDLKIRAIAGTDDKDFKWLYRLLEPNPKAPVAVGAGTPGFGPGKLFVPILDRASGPAGEEQDCTGGKIDGNV